MRMTTDSLVQNPHQQLNATKTFPPQWYLAKVSPQTPKPCSPPIPSGKQPKSAIKPPKPSPAESDTAPTVAAWDIVALKRAFPQFVWHSRQLAMYIHHQDWPFHPPSPACPKECAHRVLRADRAHPQWHGHPRCYSPSLLAYWMGIIPHIPQQAWWIPSYMPQPKGS